jgi:hypothetical protein
MPGSVSVVEGGASYEGQGAVWSTLPNDDNPFLSFETGFHVTDDRDVPHKLREEELGNGQARVVTGIRLVNSEAT